MQNLYLEAEIRRYSTGMSLLDRLFDAFLDIWAVSMP